MNDVSVWKYCVVTFSNDSKGLEDSCGIATEILQTGVWFMQNKDQFIEEVEDHLGNLVYIINIPKKFHDHPEVIKSKEQELDKWVQYKAFEEVDLDDQYVLGSRWVVGEKQDGRIKSRFVVKGNEERGDPRSD